MKYAALILLSLPVHAEPITVISVEAPVMCRAPDMEKPIPCAYMAALVAMIRPEHESTIPVMTWTH